MWALPVVLDRLPWLRHEDAAVSLSAALLLTTNSRSSLPAGSAVLFFALQQKRLRGRSGRSRNVVFSQDRGRYVKPMIPKGGL